MSHANPNPPPVGASLPGEFPPEYAGDDGDWPDGGSPPAEPDEPAP